MYQRDGTAGCFHPASGVFSSPQECEDAETLAAEIGYELLRTKDWDEDTKRRNALGYGNDQGLSVFFYNTPTSTLPIFWAKGYYRGQPWEPIFPRREKI